MAKRHPKAAARIVEKLLPLNIHGQGFGNGAIGTVNIVSVPSGTYLNREDMVQLREPHVIDHEPELLEAPAPEPIEAQTPAERKLIDELNALSYEELLQRAQQAGVLDVVPE